MNLPFAPCSDGALLSRALLSIGGEGLDDDTFASTKKMDGFPRNVYYLF